MKQATLIVLAAVLTATGCNSMKWSPLADRSRNVEKQLDDMLLKAQDSERSGDVQKAAELYGNVLSVHPGHPQACHRMAILLDKQGEFEQSDELFQRAIESGVNRAEILTDYGYSQYVRGDLKQAETMLRLALSEDQSSRRAHNNLGLVLSSLGRTENAMQQFALGGCTPEQAANNLQQVQRWQDDPVLAQATVDAVESERTASASNTLAQAGFTAKQPRTQVVAKPIATTQDAAQPTAVKQIAVQQNAVARQNTVAKQNAVAQQKAVAKENAVAQQKTAPKAAVSQPAVSQGVVAQRATAPKSVESRPVASTVVAQRPAPGAEPQQFTPVSTETTARRNPQVLKRISTTRELRRVPTDDDGAIVRLARAPE